MGRTLPTVNRLIQKEEAAFQRFRRALRRHDQQLFDTLFVYIKQHQAAISQASHALPFETMLLAIVLEQQREIERLKQQANR